MAMKIYYMYIKNINHKLFYKIQERDIPSGKPHRKLHSEKICT